MLSNERPQYYILEDGAPVPTDMLTWARWFDDACKRIVCRTGLTRGGEELTLSPNVRTDPSEMYVCVSTVFLGMDHSFAWSPTGPAILYETMVYLADGEFLAPQWRYATADAARAMHVRIVAYAQQRLSAGDNLHTDENWPDESEK